jgi:tetratricopeptide (TPR) repeat protein
MIVQDLNEALNDFSNTIQYSPNFTMAYFNRGVVRYKLMAINQYNSENTDVSAGYTLNIQLSKASSVSKSQSAIALDEDKESKRIFELELIIRDFDTCIRLNPDFIYAYFNKGNIRCMQKDYRAAILEYNEAIKRNTEFAEAYFNRGLARLSSGDTNRGIEDLSKAGELGLVDAYGIIKRMTD